MTKDIYKQADRFWDVPDRPMARPELVETYKAWQAEPGDDPATWGAKKKRLFDKLVRANLGFVKEQVIKHHRRSTVPAELEDLLQAGAIGCMRALETFNPEKGSFSTYAAHWIRWEVQKAQGVALSIGRPSYAGMPYKTYLAAEKIRMLHGREPTAEELGVTEKELQSWMAPPVSVSLSELDGRGTNRETQESFQQSGTCGPQLADTAPSAEEVLEDVTNEETLAALIPTLPRRERIVIKALLEEGVTAREVARRLGVVESMVNKLKEQALSRLRFGLEVS